jgi:hypothetical protein
MTSARKITLLSAAQSVTHAYVEEMQIGHVNNPRIHDCQTCDKKASWLLSSYEMQYDGGICMNRVYFCTKCLHYTKKMRNILLISGNNSITPRMRDLLNQYAKDVD